MVEFENFELAYVPVPKAGSTAIKTALTALGDAAPDAEDAAWVHNHMPTRRFSPEGFARYADFWRFTVIRDPIERLLAVYSDLIVGRDVMAYAADVRRGRVHLPTRPDPDFFFLNLDRYRAASFAIKHHAMKQMVFTGPDLGVYDHVYDAARLDELLADLTAMTGRALATPLETGVEPIKMRDLKPETRALIRAEAAADYEAYSGFLAAA
ncbi:MAG: sulfotransferase family 2 domain-containing protein [Pseudomonadota bacterium]|nr:sulfotransferase family 2 domain-containing protein [Pseudomonadota bacterium]